MKNKPGWTTSTFFVTMVSSAMLLAPIVQSLLEKQPQTSAAAQIGLAVLGVFYALTRTQTVQAWLRHDTAKATSAPLQTLSQPTSTGQAATNEAAAFDIPEYDAQIPAQGEGFKNANG